jgi:hypothetical protein
MSFYPFVILRVILNRFFDVSVDLVCFCRMVNKYTRTTKRQSWREEDMQKALDAVQREEMGWLLASKEFNVP